MKIVFDNVTSDTNISINRCHLCENNCKINVTDENRYFEDRNNLSERVQLNINVDKNYIYNINRNIWSKSSKNDYKMDLQPPCDKYISTFFNHFL